MDINQHRNSLSKVWNKLEQGKLTIGFMGGSITEDGRAAHNWPEPVTRWFVESFPHARITVENAAIGATGSDLAVFRENAGERRVDPQALGGGAKQSRDRLHVLPRHVRCDVP
ncbi:hypothetical protein [Paenibacillus alginolyticus]|uniref:Uncharacterized protein n=1 Tax=Paenibacillus alginolyticus TaxID=59839 RepID=A0ABT4G672_9BACL|nr:hypothetical protein [Paenibacillus alginolyticus]MCY9691679.1 hypothetical protein [Paenibacillus alginolyticus]MEC0146885.1 hypothetical protein [Paenibacillus alginolyticus]